VGSSCSDRHRAAAAARSFSSGDLSRSSTSSHAPRLSRSARKPVSPLYVAVLLHGEEAPKKSGCLTANTAVKQPRIFQSVLKPGHVGHRSPIRRLSLLRSVMDSNASWRCARFLHNSCLWLGGVDNGESSCVNPS